MQTRSDVDNLDQDALKSLITELSESSNKWRTRKFWLISIAGILALLGVISEILQDSDGDRKDIAQARLSLLQSRASESSIGEAKERASAANERAGKANEAAARANERAATLEQEAANARVKQQELAVVAEQLRKANTEGLAALEQEKRERLELEIALSPRMFKDQLAAGRALAKFAPVGVVIEYLPDFECKRTAGQITQPLHEFAKWTILAVRPNTDEMLFFDGVTVAVNSSGAVAEDVRRASDAAEALVDELNKAGIQARRHAADLNFPHGVIVVRVGMKPNPAAQRDTREQMERMGFPKETIDRVVPSRTKK